MRWEVVEEGDALRAFGQSLADPRRALAGVGALLLARAQRAFREQRGPEGEDWAPRRVPNVLGIIADLDRGRIPPARRFQPRPALEDGGRLKRSIRFRVVGKSTVEIGSNLDYARKHQFGAPPEPVVSYAVTTRAKHALAAPLKRKGPWSPYRMELGALLNKRTANRIVRVPARPFLGTGTKTLEAVHAHLRRALLGAA